MNRRKPVKRVAVVPVEEGQDLAEAVLRKSCSDALRMLTQIAEGPPRLTPFAAGYLAGYARHRALTHGVDAEQDMGRLLAALSTDAPGGLREEIASLRFAPRGTASPRQRAQLRAASARADAGYLVGHLESVCGSHRLLKAACGLALDGDADAFLTACDVAADRMQTHQPTMSLRLDSAEREIVREAFAALD